MTAHSKSFENTVPVGDLKDISREKSAQVAYHLPVSINLSNLTYRPPWQTDSLTDRHSAFYYTINSWAEKKSGFVFDLHSIFPMSFSISQKRIRSREKINHFLDLDGHDASMQGFHMNGSPHYTYINVSHIIRFCYFQWCKNTTDHLLICGELSI